MDQMSIQVNTQGYQQNQVGQIPEALTAENLRQLKQELQLATGQILSGRVTSMEGNSITLLLDSKQSISAHLNGDMPINVGQLLSFEVKSATGAQAELRPLYTNLSDTSTVGAALSEAGLPSTDRNISMVQNMMEEGMSVNKQALLDMVSQLNEHPDVNPSTIVQMQKLNLPMDETTIQQFENYQNFEHEIENDVRAMNDALAALPEELFLSGEDDAGMMKAADIFSILMDELETVAPEQVIPMEEHPIPDIVRGNRLGTQYHQAAYGDHGTSFGCGQSQSAGRVGGRRRRRAKELLDAGRITECGCRAAEPVGSGRVRSEGRGSCAWLRYALKTDGTTAGSVPS